MIERLLPRIVRGARRRGDRARDARDWARAAREYRHWLAEHPDDFAIHVQLGHMAMELGDRAGADAAYRAAAAIRPNEPDLLLCRGHLAKMLGEIEVARAFYRASLEADGNGHAAVELANLPPEPEAEIEPEPALPDEDVFLPEQEPGAAEPDEAGLLPAQEHEEVAEPEPAPVPEPEPAPPPAPPPPPPPPAHAVEYSVLKPLDFDRGELALFVAHSATGVLKPHVRPYLEALAAEGIAVYLIVNADRPFDMPEDLLDSLAGAMVRRNRGYDFAAWAHALHLNPEGWGATILHLVNDSLFGPRHGFGAMLARIRASDADLVGLTESHERGWHLQSYFLSLKAPLLGSATCQSFFAGVVALDDKDAVIQAYEVRFAAAMEQAWHRVDVLWESPTAMNPSLFAWRDLVARGFPFVKLLLLRGTFPQVDTSGWRDTLALAGFDVPLIEATLAHGGEGWLPPEPGCPLVARQRLVRRRTGPVKVAFFGPWNYDNGLGSASRGLIAAIRSSGARINLHPIKRPFHVHRPSGPAADVIDFEGPADIAVVHLNPDSWFLLTDEQRGLIAAAARRVSYWVWEMGHIPPAWWTDFRSVDRIWAPSSFCAGLFAAQGTAPVEVIPHAVPVAPAGADDRAEVLRGVGVDPGARVILYVFDGSSYLVRKNPAALVRAFSASGLAARGWTLLLKTKHLMDRPEDGAAFRALAEATAGTVLVDRPMDAHGLDLLLAACDIYASPHCAEGFGLTVAEAMAHGRAVVATDYSGTADYLDESCGWPVRAHAWTLEEDHGHYTKGGTWARIDEPALSATLRDAAAAVEAGDTSRQQAARVRVAERLSYAAVGARIAASFETILALGHPAGTPTYHEVRADAAPRFADAAFPPHIRAVPLAPDGSLAAVPEDLPEGEGDWIVFAPGDALVSDYLPQAIIDYTTGRPDIAMLHGDDVAQIVARPIDRVRRKPLFDPVLLAAGDYVGAPLIVRGTALKRIGALRPELGTALVGDLLFRGHAQGLSIGRVPNALLAHAGERPVATVADWRAMLERQPMFAGHDILPARVPGRLSLRRRFGEDAPDVTLVVPTCRAERPGGGSHVEALLDGITRTDWPMDRLTVLVGDDVAGEPDWGERPFALRRTETLRPAGAPFSYAAKMNRLWRAAATEHLVFLNDDVTIGDAGWLRALMTHAVDTGVGGVGARLLYPDGRLQHAGIAPLVGQVAHVWAGWPADQPTYQDWALTSRQWSMVTGAVFATRRAALEQVAGFDEGFALEYNDIDLCLRLRAMGYRIVYAADAELTHAEKSSRGHGVTSGGERARFLKRWGGWLSDDPAMAPYVDRNRFDLAPLHDPGVWYA